MSDEMRAIAGALMLIDKMIKVQGLEYTLEQIREVNKLHPNFNKHNDLNSPEILKEAWKGCLQMAITTNTKEGK